ncbi:hypothetical protein OUZ56_024853 [Daphnia magna]|uniref:Uncharacterized protein n=1 Tax=Daphnia magna TaxID=35525 RepID=A0ABQ9ZI58_9CRUS|nr:hypothetical protein OUZ56_024853 [Daphnia magna]
MRSAPSRRWKGDAIQLRLCCHRERVTNGAVFALSPGPISFTQPCPACIKIDCLDWYREKFNSANVNSTRKWASNVRFPDEELAVEENIPTLG